jgi:hypothetical protein
LYESEIRDGGDDPLFVVTCLEDPNNPIEISAPTASGAWAEVGKRVNDMKEHLTGKRMFTQLSGPEMFGFSHPTIARLIQEMPGAERCKQYEKQAFVLADREESFKKKSRFPSQYAPGDEDEDEEESRSDEY